MHDVRHILVPVDLQQHTERLVEFALRIADKLGAQVTIVHVVEEVEYRSDYDSASFEEFEARIRAEAERKMAAVLKQCPRSSPQCTGTLLFGRAADCIVAFARDNVVDMIIMATHGAKGIEKILLGSVADRVLKRAHCPTLVFNPYRGEQGYQVTLNPENSR